MEPILHSFAYSLDYLREMLADVPDELMAEQPRGMTNHPAWTIGHLVFIAQAIGSVIGINPWLPEDWERQFGPGSKPSDFLTGPHAFPHATLPSGVARNQATLLAALDSAQANSPPPSHRSLMPSSTRRSPTRHAPTSSHPSATR